MSSMTSLLSLRNKTLASLRDFCGHNVTKLKRIFALSPKHSSNIWRISDRTSIAVWRISSASTRRIMAILRIYLIQAKERIIKFFESAQNIRIFSSASTTVATTRRINSLGIFWSSSSSILSVTKRRNNQWIKSKDCSCF